jgi:hypothetical protein
LACSAVVLRSRVSVDSECILFHLPIEPTDAQPFFSMLLEATTLSLRSVSFLLLYLVHLPSLSFLSSPHERLILTWAFPPLRSHSRLSARQTVRLDTHLSSWFSPLFVAFAFSMTTNVWLPSRALTHTFYPFLLGRAGEYVKQRLSETYASSYTADEPAAAPVEAET